MVGVRTGLRALVLRSLRRLVLRDLEASTGKLTEGAFGELRPSRSLRSSESQRPWSVSRMDSEHWFLATWGRAQAS